MWTALFSAIAAVPKLAELIMTFVKWIQEEIDAASKKKLAEDLQKAIDKAKKDKDTGDLDAIFDPSKKP